MSHAYVGFGDYALEQVDDEFIQFVFDIAVTMAGLPVESELGVVLTTDEHMQKLNLQYRGKDAPTNVLSFGYLETAAEQFVQPGDEHYLGDIYLSRTKVISEAKEMGISEQDRFLQLYVHAILHLAGMHHDTDLEAEAMEELEDRIIEKVRE